MSDINKKKTLITGATGFIGAHLCKKLVEEGWNVHIIVRDKSDLSQIKHILNCLVLHPYNGTMTELLNIVDKVKPVIVFHLASLFITTHQESDVEPLISSNICFSTQLVEAMVRNNVYKLINTGTSWQHYDNKDYSPVCLYAATKQAFEAILQYYTDAAPLSTITLELYDTYGPDDKRKKLFSLFRENAQTQTLLNMSPGEQLLNIVYIDDVIDAYLESAKQLLESPVKMCKKYSVSSDTMISLRNVASIYSEVTGKQLNLNWGGKPYREREVMIPWDNGESLPRWQPKVNIEKGIRIMEQQEV